MLVEFLSVNLNIIFQVVNMTATPPLKKNWKTLQKHQTTLNYIQLYQVYMIADYHLISSTKAPYLVVPSFLCKLA